jgi:hypothetical protein
MPFGRLELAEPLQHQGQVVVGADQAGGDAHRRTEAVAAFLQQAPVGQDRAQASALSGQRAAARRATVSASASLPQRSSISAWWQWWIAGASGRAQAWAISAWAASASPRWKAAIAWACSEEMSDVCGAGMDLFR